MLWHVLVLLAVLTGAASAQAPCLLLGAAGLAVDCTIAATGGRAPTYGDSGPASQAWLRRPGRVRIGPDGAVWVADSGHNFIRRIDPSTGVISIVVNAGAGLRAPRDLAWLPDRTLLVADTGNRRIVRIDAQNQVRVVADSLAAESIAADARGNIYTADRNRIFAIDPAGAVRTLAGDAVAGNTGDGGPAARARVGQTDSLHVDARNVLWFRSIADGAARIRRIRLDNESIDGMPGAPPAGPFTLVDEDTLLIAQPGGILRYRVAIDTATPIAPNERFDNAANAAQDAAGAVYVADTNNNRIRRVRGDQAADTFAGRDGIEGDGVPIADAVLFGAQGFTFDAAGNLYFADPTNQRIRRLAPGGIVTTVAGNGLDYSGDGGPPLRAGLGAPAALRFDRFGALLLIDQTEGGVIRRITPGEDGVIDGSADERIATVAGRLGAEPDNGAADQGPALRAVFAGLRAMAFDRQGNLFVADWLGHRIRKISPGADGVVGGAADELVTTVVGTGEAATGGNGGDGVRAATNGPRRIAVDAEGNVYFTESPQNARETNVIRRWDAIAGTVNRFVDTPFATPQAADLHFDAFGNLWAIGTRQAFRRDVRTSNWEPVAGSGREGSAGDGGDSRQAEFGNILGGAAFDARGDLTLYDTAAFRLRKVSFTPRNPVRITSNPATLTLADTARATLRIESAPTGALVSLLPRQSWLRVVESPGGVAPSTFTVTAELSGLGSGVHQGELIVQSPAAAGELRIPVTLTVSGARISAGGVAGAGASIPPVRTGSPNTWVTVYGENFAPRGTDRRLGPGDVVNGRLPTRLANVCVYFDGQAAALGFVRPGQVNAVVPAFDTPRQVNVEVATDCGAANERRSRPERFEVRAVSPEFIYFDNTATGRNRVIAVHNTTGSFGPFAAGDIVSAFLFGLGATNPVVVPGSVPTSAAAAAASPARVFLGGREVAAEDVFYAGVTPNSAGLYQVTFRVPQGAGAGEIPIVLEIGGVRTGDGPYLSLR